MHSGYEITGIQQQPQSAAENAACAPVLLSMNQTQFLDQIHTLPAVQQRLFLDQSHFLPPQTRLSQHYIGGDSSSSEYFPAANFKLGPAKEVCSRNNEYNSNNKNNMNSINEEVGGNLLHGSDRYQVTEAQQSSLGMLPCWQNQQDSPNIKHPPSFWEHLAMSEASNENSEIVEMSHKAQPPVTHFGELEAIYKPLAIAEAEQSGPCGKGPAHPPESRRKRKKKRVGGGCPMAEVFGKLVRRVVEHQESMHRRLAEVLERMEEERAAREDEWRRWDAERVKREAEARAKEKALARDREVVIVSYLERITGEKVGICSGYQGLEASVPTPTD